MRIVYSPTVNFLSVNLFHCVYVVLCLNITWSKSPICHNNMCLGNCLRGRDVLRRNILETHYTIDLPDNCDYIECDNSINIDPWDVSFLELNIRGMYTKLPELMHLIDHISDNQVPDVLLLCETWLTKHTPSFSIQGYNICRTDRDG